MKTKLRRLILLALLGILPLVAETNTPIEGNLTVPSSGGQIGYYANQLITKSNENITRAIIVIHGTNRNAQEYYDTIAKIAKDEGEENRTLIIAPHFKIESDVANSLELQWSNSGGWKSGSKSRSKANLTRVSSFTVMDELLTQITNNDTFPNLKNVVLTGHSAGGQFTHRYALSTQLDITQWGYNIRYVVANPSSYTYVDAQRPTVNGFVEPSSSEVANCPEYNDYKYGLNNRYSYLSSLSVDELREQYLNREVIYLLGTDDTAIDSYIDTGCEANLQGENRYVRGLNYWNYINSLSLTHKHLLSEVEGVGHTRTGMYSSINGIKALFRTTNQSDNSNYLVNPEAEEGTTGWTTFGGGTDIQTSTTRVHKGSYSFLSENRTQFYHGPSQNIKPLVDNGQLIDGERYTASVWVYHRESTAKKLYLNIKKVDESGTEYLRLEDELIPPNTWVKIVKHFVLDVDTSLQNFNLYLSSASGETFDFYSDNFYLGTLESYTPPSSSKATEFIRANGKNLIDGTGNTIVLKGINVQVPVDADNTPQDIWDVKSVSLKDFQNIKNMGFNSIRLHLNYKTFEDDSDIGIFKEDGWHWLDRAISYAKEVGIYLLLDMHGGQGGYQSDKAQGFSAFWDGLGTLPNTSNQNRLINLWGAIANRYQHETIILGYDLLNEPRPNDSEEWLSYAEQLIKKIRTQDTNHLIVVEVPLISNFTMRLVNDNNVMYDAHTYAIWGYSTQYSVHYGKEGERWGAYSNINPLYVNSSWNVVWEPTDGGTPPSNSEPFNKNFLETLLVDEIMEFTNSNNIPVNVGEYGSVRETFVNNVGALELLRDTHKIMNGSNRYATQVNRFYFTYQSSVFGLYGSWNGFQVNEADVNIGLKNLFLNENNNSDSGDNGSDGTDNNDTVEDTTVPIITLIGEAIVNLNVTESYNDAGATAIDDVDGDISNSIVRTGEVDINVAGTYVLTYNVQDSSLNAAKQVTRTVIVNSNDTENNDSNTVQTDLKLEFTWGNYPKVPVIGRAHKFVAKIYNISDVLATETKLNITLPDGATLYKGRGCQLNEDELSISCDIGNIKANQRRTRTIYLRLNEGGDIRVNAKVLSSIDENDVSNNEAMVNLYVSKEADLSVTLNKQGTARIGKALGIKMRTKNKGPAFATEVTTILTLAENTSFVSNASSACSFKEDEHKVYCEWGRLNKNASRTTYIYIRPLEKGSIELEAEVGDMEENDPNSINNQAFKSYRVR